MGEALGQLLLCWWVRVPPTPTLQKSLLRVNHMFILNVQIYKNKNGNKTMTQITHTHTLTHKISHITYIQNRAEGGREAVEGTHLSVR